MRNRSQVPFYDFAIRVFSSGPSKLLLRYSSTGTSVLLTMTKASYISVLFRVGAAILGGKPAFLLAFFARRD